MSGVTTDWCLGLDGYLHIFFAPQTCFSTPMMRPCRFRHDFTGEWQQVGFADG